MQEIIQKMLNETTLWAPRVLGVMVVVIVYLALLKLLKTAINKLSERLDLDANLSTLLSRSIRIILIILAFVTILGTLGINVTALVAGLGLSGFAIGFAMKDTISNLLAGVLLMLYEPFVIGDTIRVSGFEGQVISIDMRYTQLISSGSRILLPNSKLFTDPITVINLKSGIEE